eukprot:14599657-Alexandrium_andersonii.AAC.1
MASIRSSNCRTCTIASGARSSNCVGPGPASELIPGAPEGAFCAFFRADSESDVDERDCSG